jgi:hypothetical protein
MKIKTKLTKQEEDLAEKLELENTYFKNLGDMEKKLKEEEAQVFSPLRDDIIEGKITPNQLMDNYAVRGESRKMTYPSLSRYMQLIREKFMRKGVDAGREDTLPKYLDRFDKNIKK